ncbi:Uncharacterized protein dnm_085490 [Desulfonema magnum]|uniref:Uncharacterized protein n=1 Tax=Desulfonema magnum TaxID=45655 RepID=A0A975BWF6_9BACT|nr:Uncharacterized protein dnm_085490 [Desulfonema magnum]
MPHIRIRIHVYHIDSDRLISQTQKLNFINNTSPLSLSRKNPSEQDQGVVENTEQSCKIRPLICPEILK